jgi:maltose alpha-D-glucosyltransferase / alpha-amylase
MRIVVEASLWYKDAVFYELYVRAFRDSNGDGHGDLRGVINCLDYLVDLGVDCLWLLPTYPSPLVDDGYDIADYYGVHSAYGTLDDFRELVAAAHARGLKVITDLVLNHTSDQHPWFQASRRRQEPYTDYYVWSDSDQIYRDARIIFVDTEPSNWSWDSERGQYYWHRFFKAQPDLNYDCPAVQEEMLRVMRFWMDLGLDGFRADAVPYLFERNATNCENLPETHGFLKRVRAVLEAEYPHAILLAEANQWPEDVRPYFGGDSADPSVPGDEFHMGFHFPVMPRLYMALSLADRKPVVDILRRTPPTPFNCQWCTFLRNHDELTLEMVTEEERQWMWSYFASEPRMRLNLGIRRRLAPLLGNDRRKIELLNSLLFTLLGSPVIYYGDEIGMGDNIWLPDRNGVRTPMQWDSSPNAGFSMAAPDRLYNPLIVDPEYGYDHVNVAAQRADPCSLWNTLRRMVAIRKEYRAFGWGAFELLPVENPAVLAVVRTHGREVILAVHNFSADAQPVLLDLRPWRAVRVQPLLAQRDFPDLGGEPYNLTLEPYEYFWLRLEPLGTAGGE